MEPEFGAGIWSRNLEPEFGKTTMLFLHPTGGVYSTPNRLVFSSSYQNDVPGNKISSIRLVQ